ncbi:queuosine precursor transporter [Thiotrichales bacterium 19X7-9]|nr:queuosine precursor transporter [Thiotrichales bacterium 19X7-9]
MNIKLLVGFKKYTVLGYSKNDQRETIVEYAYPNKRSPSPNILTANEIIKNKGLYLSFNQEDLINIVSFAQRDSIMLRGDIDEELLKFDKKRAKYQWYPYLVAITTIVWCFTSVIAHRFLSISILGVDFMLPGGILFFPVVYFCADAIQEVYGYKRVRQTLWVCIASHLALLLMTLITLAITPASSVNVSAYTTVFDTQLRMFLGNNIGMIAGFTLNGYVFSKLKIKYNGDNLWLRSIMSTFLAEAVFSIVCTTIDFNPNLSMINLIKLQLFMIFVKAMWEVFFTPALYGLTYVIKRREGIDVYDRYTNFNPFSLDVDYKNQPQAA